MGAPTTEVFVPIHDLMRQGSRLAMQRLHHSGRRPVRVLLVGDREQLFDEVADGTCADRCADRIWLTTRRGVDLDVLTDLAPVLRAVHGVFDTWRLWRYDVVLVLLGEGLDAPSKPRTIARVGELLAEVLADAAGAADVVVLGPDAGTDTGAHSRHAALPEDRLRETVARLHTTRVRYRALPATADPLARTRAWAVAVADEVAMSLQRLAVAEPATTAAHLRNTPDEESERQRALDRLAIVGAPSEPRLEDLVELARSAFGTDCAEINFIDHDQQWKAAVSGAERTPGQRADSFCNLTIQRDAPFVVSDARFDPLLRFSPLVSGPNAIRFYAAHPIESLDGYRIGSFCVYDHAPRDIEGMNLDVLRDLALLAQAEITGADAPPIGSELRRA